MDGRTDGQTDRQADRKRDRIEAKQHSSCRNVANKEFGHDLGVLWSRACGVLFCCFRNLEEPQKNHHYARAFRLSTSGR